MPDPRVCVLAGRSLHGREPRRTTPRLLCVVYDVLPVMRILTGRRSRRCRVRHRGAVTGNPVAGGPGLLDAAWQLAAGRAAGDQTSRNGDLLVVFSCVMNVLKR